MDNVKFENTKKNFERLLEDAKIALAKNEKSLDEAKKMRM